MQQVLALGMGLHLHLICASHHCTHMLQLPRHACPVWPSRYILVVKTDSKGNQQWQQAIGQVLASISAAWCDQLGWCHTPQQHTQ